MKRSKPKAEPNPSIVGKWFIHKSKDYVIEITAQNKPRSGIRFNYKNRPMSSAISMGRLERNYQEINEEELYLFNLLFL